METAKTIIILILVLALIALFGRSVRLLDEQDREIRRLRDALYIETSYHSEEIRERDAMWEVRLAESDSLWWVYRNRWMKCSGDSISFHLARPWAERQRADSISKPERE